MLYKLECVSNDTNFTPVMCEIETNVALESILNAYLKQEKSSNLEKKGYWQEKILKKNVVSFPADLLYHEKNDDGNINGGKNDYGKFNVYKEDELLNFNNEYYYGDLRRVLADILYVLYIKEDKKIERLNWNGTKYTDITAVKMRKQHSKKKQGWVTVELIQFEAKTENGSSKVLLLPVSLCEDSNLEYILSSCLYVLESENEKINIKWKSSMYGSQHQKQIFGTERTICCRWDFFTGTYKDMEGFFIQIADEMYPVLARNDNGTWIRKILPTDTEEKLENNFSKEESEYFVSQILESDDLEKIESLWTRLKEMKRFPNESKVSLDGNVYTGKRNLHTYRFSDIQSEHLMIDCELKSKVDSAINNVVVDSINQIEIKLKNKPIISLDSGKLCYIMEKIKKIEEIEETEEIVVSLKELKNHSIISWNPFELADGHTIEETVKEIKEKSAILQEEIVSHIDEIKALAKTETEVEIEEVLNMLFPAPLVPDKNVAKIVYEEKKKYEKTGKMPNFVIMGGPGTGKSTLVEKIAAYIKGFQKDENCVLKKSVSDLKGAYVGQTANRVFDLLEKAYEEEKIVFIDEAYNLQSDKFGKEALEMLLPLLSGDRNDVECIDLESKNQASKRLEFEKGVPGIWLAGYEHETRKMLVENPGLYRRMVKLSLTEPTVEGLYINLLEKAKDTYLYDVFEQCKREIKNYFGWAAAKEHIAYFGNYAGVEDFYRTCEVRIEKPIKRARSRINEIIEEKKHEIKKQYKAVLTEKEVLKFEVQRDINAVLDDVKGNERTVSNLEQIVTMLLQREIYEKEGIYVPKGALLVGPPGTGKTMLARAVAGEIQKRYDDIEKKEKSVAFIPVAATDLYSPELVKALFEEAEEYDSCVIFIDEVDVIGKHREINPNAKVLIQLMKEMDGFEQRKNIFVMAATNAPEVLDPALKRPGRFDRNIEVNYPNLEGRKAILLSYLEKLTEIVKRIQEEDEGKTLADLAQEVAEKTVAFVPADLKNLVNEAAILYKSSNKNSKHRENVKIQSVYEYFRADLFEVLERINVGELVEERKEKEFQVSENKGCSSVAIHEVGHALVSVLLGIEPFEKLTIISRGDALGYVSPSQKNMLRTKADFLKKIKVCLGGRIAEEIFYGEDISTGAVQDIQQATSYAENMVMLYGMSEEIGPMALKNYQRNYLGKGQDYRCSEEFRCKAEEEIKQILKEQFNETKGMLKSQKEVIQELAKVVFDKETLTGEEFKEVYKEIAKRK